VILKVVQHTPGGTQPFAAVRQQVEETAFMNQMQPRLREYLVTLRQNAYIDVRPGYVDTAAVHSSAKPLYSAYTPPGPKKKVHFKRRRYTGQNRGRHANATATETAANTNATDAAGSTATATKTTAGGTTTAVANTPAVEKPGKKEKIRFGQAPREALPPAAHTQSGAQQAAAGTEGSGEAQVASNSSSADIPSAEEATPVERKTRFSERARAPKVKKTKTPDQVENERVAQQATSEEAATEKTQSAPLGLAGDTATKKKAPKPKGEKKTRYSDEVNKSKQPEPAQPSTPSPLATPGTAPASTDNGTLPAQPNGGSPTAPAQPQP
jgi:peptidyl-prolyl cis-trans isomerase SurA